MTSSSVSAGWRQEMKKGLPGSGGPFFCRLWFLPVLVFIWCLTGPVQFKPLNAAEPAVCGKLPPKVGAVAVLGKGHQEEGRPSQDLAQRVGAGVAAMKKLRAPYLVLCGGITSGHLAEAEEMAVMAVALGVPAKKILVEAASMNTKENAQLAAIPLKRRGIRSVLVVTQSDHVERAAKQFSREKVARKVFGHCADSYDFSAKPGKLKVPPPDLAGIDGAVVHGPYRVPGREPELLVMPDEWLGLARGLVEARERNGKSLPALLWFRPYSGMRMRPAEKLGLAAMSMGYPPAELYYSEGRRFNKGEDPVEFAVSKGWKTVLLVYPRSLARELERLTALYTEKGVTVVPWLATLK